MKRGVFLLVAAALFAACACYADGVEDAYKEIALECQGAFSSFISSYDDTEAEIEEEAFRYGHDGIKSLFLMRAGELQRISAKGRESVWADDAAYFVKFLKGNFVTIRETTAYLEKMLTQYPDFKAEDWSVENLQAFSVFKSLRPFFILQGGRADISIVKKEIFVMNFLLKTEGIRSYLDIKERLQQLKKKYAGILSGAGK